MNKNCSEEYQTKLETSIKSDIGAHRYVNTPYYAKVAPLIEQYRTAVVLDTKSTVDQTLLVSNTSALNLFVHTERSTSNTFVDTYPNLEERLVITPFLTPAETQTFINSYLYEPTTFVNSLVPYNPNVLISLNNYFRPSGFSNSGMTSFCALVPNIFAGYQALKDAFSQIGALALNFEQMLADVQDITLNGMLTQLKDQMMSIIDQMVINTKAILGEFTSTFTDSSNYKYNLSNIHSKTIRERENINAFISDPSIDTLKTTLTSSLSFVASLFEELRIEEIQFIILRFCELMSNVEHFFSDITRPLQDTIENYKYAFNVLRGASSYGEARAVTAGALRFGITDRTVGMDTAVSISSSGSDSTGGSLETGAAMRQRSARAEPISASEADEAGLYMTYEAVYLSGNSPYVLYQPGPNSASGGRYGWDNVQPLEKIMLMRLAKSLGVKLYINSAWRSLATQAKIRAESGNPSSIPKSGYHQSGQAFDVSRYTISNENMFINKARSLGFGGIGRYDTFIHIDSRFGDVTFR